MQPRFRTLTAILLAVGPICGQPLEAQRDWPKGTIVVSNMNDSSATLVDAERGTVRATLPTGRGPHEVAASHDGRWAVVSNYGVRGSPGNTLTVIDVARAQVTRTIDLGEYRRPHGAKFLPGDTLLVVTCETKQLLLVIEFATGRVVRTLPTNARTSHMVAVTANGDRYFSANIADGSISVIDPSGRDSTRTIGVARATEGIAVTPDGRRVWVGSNADSIVVSVDPSGATRPDTVRGFGMPYRLAVTPDSRLVIVTDPVRGEIHLLDAKTSTRRAVISVPADSLVTTAEVPGSPSPEGVAVSHNSRWAFVTLQGRNRVIWIDLERAEIVRSAPTGTWSDGIAYARPIGS